MISKLKIKKTKKSNLKMVIIEYKDFTIMKKILRKKKCEWKPRSWSQVWLAIDKLRRTLNLYAIAFPQSNHFIWKITYVSKNIKRFTLLASCMWHISTTLIVIINQHFYCYSYSISIFLHWDYHEWKVVLVQGRYLRNRIWNFAFHVLFCFL